MPQTWSRVCYSWTVYVHSSRFNETGSIFSYFVSADAILLFHRMAELEEPVDGPLGLPLHVFISSGITF